MTEQVQRDSLLEFKTELKDEFRRLSGATSHQYEKLDDKLDELNAVLAQFGVRGEHRDQKITGLEHAVYGNGRPGLKADVQNVSNHMDRFDSDIHELKASVNRGFKSISDKQVIALAKEEAAIESAKTRKVKLMAALLGALGAGGGLLKLIEALV